MGHKVEHNIIIQFNKEKFDELLESKNQSYTEFHNGLVKTWGLDISYKGFMGIIGNKVDSLLIYPYTIAKHLGVEIEELIVIKGRKK